MRYTTPTPNVEMESSKAYTGTGRSIPCYLVPSSRVRLLVIAMIIFLQVSRSLAEPHSSVRVHFVTALMSSSQRGRGLPLFLVPPPIPSIIDFSKLFSLRMICPKYDSCCFFINVSNGLVAFISSRTDLKVDTPLKIVGHVVRATATLTNTTPRMRWGKPESVSVAMPPSERLLVGG